MSRSPSSCLRVHTSASLLAHRGNKRDLPSKPCLACGRPMSWRRRWARDWESVRYCSHACRARARRSRRAPDLGS